MQINNVEYNVDQNFLDIIATKLSKRLALGRSNRLETDQTLVKSELVRIFPGLDGKPWFRDFVVAYCKDHRIPCKKELL